MRTLAVFVAIPVFVVAWQSWRDHSIEQRLQPIAEGVSGRHVQVDCQSFWGALLDAQAREGEVRYLVQGVPEPKLFLTHRVCVRLRKFAGHAHHGELDCLAAIDWATDDPLPYGSDCYERAAGTIYAVLVLAHESYHTVDVEDEAAANCFAIQAMAWTATRLGAATSEAELMARAMEALEPMQGSPYGTTECHAGGKLDLHGETPDFPTEQPIAPPLGRGGKASLIGT
jgi:hypothetical protein